MTDKVFEQLQSLLPPVSYDPNGKLLSAQMTAEANALQGALEQLEGVEAAIFPESAGSYISDWERVYGITPAPGATQEQRVQAVLAAMSDMGGQSIPYFVRLASLFGVPVDIETFRVPVAGGLSTGAPMYSGDWPYTWRVNAPLGNYFNTPMEQRITERRPANTEVVFGYGKEVVAQVAAAVDQIFGTINYVTPSSLSDNNV